MIPLMPTTSALCVAIVNDYELVVAGVAAVLEPFADRVEVVELDSSVPVISKVDVILYDTFGAVQGDRLDLEDLVRDGQAKVIVFSWNLQPELIRQALQRGASGYLSKSLSGEEIVDSIERVCSGEAVVPAETAEAQAPEHQAGGSWPGQARGLTAREAEVIALITQGLSNQEIADRSYLSINSIKTYIRTAYRKMGVTRRSQAVLWGVANGFEPRAVRVVNGVRQP